MLDIVLHHLFQGIVQVSLEGWQVKNYPMYCNNAPLEAVPDLVDVDILNFDGVHATGQVLGQELVNWTTTKDPSGLIDTVPN
jgi:hypothetical protein